jgi:flagellar hook-length control protein FliK
MIPGIGDENVSALAPKASGVWTSQQISLAGQLRHDATTLRPDFSGANSGAAVTLPGQILAVSQQDAGVRALERPIKQHHNRFGSGGEGVYGQPLASANPADSLFQVVPTTSAAASTVVAETVSYWASQGVHSASLQLEGLGDEPVEVRISVNGDMAQVDFRTNQPEVRQTIEAAASQLKELLTSQGIQLTGMSIGTSGRGGSQEKDTKRTPEGRKVAMLKSEAVEKPRLRGANPSVGQALDLFV